MWYLIFAILIPAIEMTDWIFPTHCVNNNWVKSPDKVPIGAIFGGEDRLSKKSYVIRGLYENNLLPGKFSVKSDGSIPGSAVTGFNGHSQVFNQDQFEYLTNLRVSWMPTDGTNIPVTAVPVGYLRDGTTLYSGRAYAPADDGLKYMTCGLVNPKTGTLEIDWHEGGRETYVTREYEILIYY